MHLGSRKPLRKLTPFPPPVGARNTEQIAGEGAGDEDDDDEEEDGDFVGKCNGRRDS